MTQDHTNIYREVVFPSLACGLLGEEVKLSVVDLRFFHSLEASTHISSYQMI